MNQKKQLNLFNLIFLLIIFYIGSTVLTADDVADNGNKDSLSATNTQQREDALTALETAVYKVKTFFPGASTYKMIGAVGCTDAPGDGYFSDISDFFRRKHLIDNPETTEIISAKVSAGIYKSRLTAPESMHPGDSLYSSNGVYELNWNRHTLQLSLYQRIDNIPYTVWDAWGFPLVEPVLSVSSLDGKKIYEFADYSKAFYMIMQEDGNLVIYQSEYTIESHDKTSYPVLPFVNPWINGTDFFPEFPLATNTWNTLCRYLTVQNDGNLVLYESMPGNGGKTAFLALWGTTPIEFHEKGEDDPVMHTLAGVSRKDNNYVVNKKEQDYVSFYSSKGQSQRLNVELGNEEAISDRRAQEIYSAAMNIAMWTLPIAIDVGGALWESFLKSAEKDLAGDGVKVRAEIKAESDSGGGSGSDSSSSSSSDTTKIVDNNTTKTQKTPKQQLAERKAAFKNLNKEIKSFNSQAKKVGLSGEMLKKQGDMINFKNRNDVLVRFYKNEVTGEYYYMVLKTDSKGGPEAMLPKSEYPDGLLGKVGRKYPGAVNLSDLSDNEMKEIFSVKNIRNIQKANELLGLGKDNGLKALIVDSIGEGNGCVSGEIEMINAPDEQGKIKFTKDEAGKIELTGTNRYKPDMKLHENDMVRGWEQLDKIDTQLKPFYNQNLADVGGITTNVVDKLTGTLADNASSIVGKSKITLEPLKEEGSYLVTQKYVIGTNDDNGLFQVIGEVKAKWTLSEEKIVFNEVTGEPEYLNVDWETSFSELNFDDPDSFDDTVMEQLSKDENSNHYFQDSNSPEDQKVWKAIEKFRKDNPALDLSDNPSEDSGDSVRLSTILETDEEQLIDTFIENENKSNQSNSKAKSGYKGYKKAFKKLMSSNRDENKDIPIKDNISKTEKELDDLIMKASDGNEASKNKLVELGYNPTDEDFKDLTMAEKKYTTELKQELLNKQLDILSKRDQFPLPDEKFVKSDYEKDEGLKGFRNAVANLSSEYEAEFLDEFSLKSVSPLNKGNINILSESLIRHLLDEADSGAEQAIEVLNRLGLETDNPQFKRLVDMNGKGGAFAKGQAFCKKYIGLYEEGKGDDLVKTDSPLYEKMMAQAKKNAYEFFDKNIKEAVGSSKDASVALKNLNELGYYPTKKQLSIESEVLESNAFKDALKKLEDDAIDKMLKEKNLKSREDLGIIDGYKAYNESREELGKLIYQVRLGIEDAADELYKLGFSEKELEELGCKPSSNVVKDVEIDSLMKKAGEGNEGAEDAIDTLIHDYGYSVDALRNKGINIKYDDSGVFRKFDSFVEQAENGSFYRMQELKKIGIKPEVSSDEVSNKITKLINDAKKGDNTAIKKLKTVGVDMEDHIDRDAVDELVSNAQAGDSAAESNLKELGAKDDTKSAVLTKCKELLKSGSKEDLEKLQKAGVLEKWVKGNGDIDSIIDGVVNKANEGDATAIKQLKNLGIDAKYNSKSVNNKIIALLKSARNGDNKAIGNLIASGFKSNELKEIGINVPTKISTADMPEYYNRAIQNLLSDNEAGQELSIDDINQAYKKLNKEIEDAGSSKTNTSKPANKALQDKGLCLNQSQLSDLKTNLKSDSFNNAQDKLIQENMSGKTDNAKNYLQAKQKAFKDLNGMIYRARSNGDTNAINRLKALGYNVKKYIINYGSKANTTIPQGIGLH